MSTYSLKVFFGVGSVTNLIKFHIPTVSRSLRSFDTMISQSVVFGFKISRLMRHFRYLQKS